jgi:dihydroflavonol-4-reductase
MTTLVTGGTGFLGRWLVKELLDRDAPVRVLSRSYDAELDALGVDLVEGSIEEAGDIARALEGVDRVYHLAGRVERDRSKAHRMFSLHVDGTRRLLEQAADAGVSKVVAASTSGTVGVGEHADFVGHDDSPFAERVVRNWPYYLSKIYAEKEADRIARETGLAVVQMRPTLLLGPGDLRQSSTGDVAMFMRRRIPTLLDGGLSFVDVRDVATAFIAGMEHAEPGSKYLLGSANMTLEQFFGELAKLTGIPAPPRRIPDSLAVAGARMLRGAMRLAGADPELDPSSVEMARHYWYIDWSKARRELGFAPREPLETLRDTVSWIRRNDPEFRSERSVPPSEWVRSETIEWADSVRDDD